MTGLSNEPDELDVLRQRGNEQSRCDRDVSELVAELRRALDSSGPQPPASPELAAFLARQESQEDVPGSMSGWPDSPRAPEDMGPGMPAGSAPARAVAPQLLVQVAARNAATPDTATGGLISSRRSVARLLIGAAVAAALVVGIGGGDQTSTTVP